MRRSRTLRESLHLSGQILIHDTLYGRLSFLEATTAGATVRERITGQHLQDLIRRAAGNTDS